MENRKITIRHRLSPLLPAALLFVLAYLLPSGTRVMIRPDEFRYAEIPREMLASGNWMRPRLNGVKYFEKPVLGYQLTALNLRLFGETPFAVRLASVLGTLLAAATVYLVCRRDRRDRIWPGVAVCVFLAFGLVLGVGSYAVLDAAFSGAVTASIGAIQLSWRSKRRTGRIGWLAAAGVFAAGAFMIKGFLAFILPAAAIGPWLLWNREWKKLLTWPWLPLVAAAVIAVPWALVQHRAEPDFWRYFFIEEHWKRFTSGTYDRDPQPFWYFIPVLLGGVLPAGLLWFAGYAGVVKAWLKRPEVRCQLCWALFPFLLFSAASCKLGTYILPCFPPLALLLTGALRNARRRDRVGFGKRLRRIGRCIGAGVLLVAAVAILAAVAVAVVPALKPLRVWINHWSVLTVAALAVWSAALYRRSGSGKLRTLWLLLTGFAPAVCFGMAAIPAAGMGSRTPEAGLRQCLRRFPDHAECRIAVERTCIAPVCWVTKRSDLIVAGNKLGELRYGLTNYPAEYAGRHFDNREFPRLVAETPRGKLLYVTFYDLKKRPLPKNWPTPLERHTAAGVTVLRF